MRSSWLQVQVDWDDLGSEFWSFARAGQHHGEPWTGCRASRLAFGKSELFFSRVGRKKKKKKKKKGGGRKGGEKEKSSRAFYVDVPKTHFHATVSPRLAKFAHSAINYLTVNQHRGRWHFKESFSFGNIKAPRISRCQVDLASTCERRCHASCRIKVMS